MNCKKSYESNLDKLAVLAASGNKNASGLIAAMLVSDDKKPNALWNHYKEIAAEDDTKLVEDKNAKKANARNTVAARVKFNYSTYRKYANWAKTEPNATFAAMYEDISYALLWYLTECLILIHSKED